MNLTTLYATLMFLAAALSASFGVYVSRRRAAPGAGAIAAFLFAAAWWNSGYGLELLSADLPAAIFWARIEYLGIVIVPAAWMIFALEYTHHRTPRLAGWALWIEPLLTIVLVWTNDWHKLIWQNIWLEQNGLLLLFASEHGLFFWAHTFYSYALVLLGTWLLLQQVIRSRQFFQAQAVSLVLAVIFPWVGNALYLSELIAIDPTPLAFAASGVAIALGVFRFRLFDVLPVARDAVMETMADAVIILDHHHRIVDINRAAESILICRARYVIGQPLSDICSEELRRLLGRLSAPETTAELLIGASENRRYYEVRVAPLPFGPRDSLVGRLITLHDITERKMVETVLAQARDQALEASRLKTRMLANVSHDLRTPLNSILGYAEMLQETASGDDHEILRRVVYNTRQMSFLVNDLLDQSALDSGQLKIHTAFFSPKALLEDTCQIMLPLAQEKGLSLQWVLDPYLPAEITGDSKRLQQVLINLTNNAVKFTDQGTISIRLFLETETSWGMEVSDTGLGIAPEAQIFIFEPFRQAETPAGRKQKGVGLGLSIVKQLVHIMGGNVRVESQVGRGSTFTVSLPLVRPPEGAS